MKHDLNFRVLPGDCQNETPRHMRLFEMTRDKSSLEMHQERWRNATRVRVSKAEMLQLLDAAQSSLRPV